ncbi:MAG: AMP-binding protein, partial [Rhodospirillum sp.]|nr:AMP-binding protein [Rhodospirillum sp.]
GAIDLADLLARSASDFSPVDTAADDPALVIYTSGTTGKPKGALHAHRVLLGHLPGVEMPHDFFPREGDLFWTPADWAWIGGLLDVLLPSLFHGKPVLAHRAAKFDPDAALDLMARHRVRNVFMPPTALRMIRHLPDERVRGRVALRSLGSGGETLGRDLLDWGTEVLGVPINEFYGQTECNLVVANNAALFPTRPGAMGKAVPGHRVAIIGEDGREKADGELGLVAIARPDPVIFLEYWNNPEATAGKFIGDWLVTGDMGHRDPEGYLWFKGRDDDVITSAGYRIGPGEVEDVLSTHPAVAQVAVVGMPDPERTEVVKAFIVPKDLKVLDDPERAARLGREIQDFAKTRHAAHAYPRQIAFLEALPTTATGKIRRKDLRELT